MAGRLSLQHLFPFHALPCMLIACLVGCAASPQTSAERTAPTLAAASVLIPSRPAEQPRATFPVMLGIDVLEADGFSAVRGKRIGLLTHRAGVNRRGESTISVLRRAPQTTLVCLFAPEHGLDGEIKAAEDVGDSIHQPTGLPIYSIYGRNKRPTPAQLKGLDAVVIDLQDIGVRSYTFASWMRYTMEACFEEGVEVILLDRPNPLGGLKVSGPPLDHEHMSDVGAFRIPYVHGLTMAELARMAATAPGVLNVPDATRAKGELTIVPMRGWNRSMRWPETGLTFVPTSPMIQDFAAVVGYAMIGLGCEFSGFRHGIGASYPFRGLSFRGKSPDVLIRDLQALNVPGLNYRKIAVPSGGAQPLNGVYVEVTDWDSWNPTELSFHLMRLACVYDPSNPFAKLNTTQARTFNIHVGSTEWWNALRRDGADVNLEAFLESWESRSKIYQQQARRYWLYQ